MMRAQTASAVYGRSNFGSIDFVSRTDARKIVIGPSDSIAFAGLPLPGDRWLLKRSEGDEVHLVYCSRMPRKASATSHPHSSHR
jgi:hypothetical protein